MSNCTWNHLSDVYDNGANYMYSLLCDYDKYMQNYGYISLQDFLPSWTCIPHQVFSHLTIGDTVYLPNGAEYIVMDDAYVSDDEIHLYIEITPLKADGSFDDTGSSNETAQSGDLYKMPVTHSDYTWKKKKIESEGPPLCPILITKTNQHQN